FCATTNGFLRFKQYTYLSECHKDCKCSEKCRGKIFKRGRTIPVMLFKTPNCGWGLRTCAFIPNNKFVMEYVGHVKLHVECRDIKDETYLFNIDTDNGEPIFVIDATDYGNSSRFINHSCDPNLEVVLVKGYFNGHFYSRVTFFSVRKIQAGEELTFNYFKHDVDLSKINPKLSPPPECFCGYEKCRKYLI
uniref:SET domain-containing protein n=1 Tax=Panagrolaimus sp. PS1159 TaxID=55785 RepID=A0AC35FTD0_9BILA